MSVYRPVESTCKFELAPETTQRSPSKREYVVTNLMMTVHVGCSGVEQLLGWDEMVMMPPSSAESRGAQKTLLAGMMHEKKTDPEIGSLLKTIEASGGELSGTDAAVVREARRECAPPPSRPLHHDMVVPGTDGMHRTKWTRWYSLIPLDGVCSILCMRRACSSANGQARDGHCLHAVTTRQAA